MSFITVAVTPPLMGTTRIFFWGFRLSLRLFHLLLLLFHWFSDSAAHLVHPSHQQRKAKAAQLMQEQDGYDRQVQAKEAKLKVIEDTLASVEAHRNESSFKTRLRKAVNTYKAENPVR